MYRGLSMRRRAAGLARAVDCAAAVTASVPRQSLWIRIRADFPTSGGCARAMRIISGTSAPATPEDVRAHGWLFASPTEWAGTTSAKWRRTRRSKACSLVSANATPGEPHRRATDAPGARRQHARDRCRPRGEVRRARAWQPRSWPARCATIARPWPTWAIRAVI